MAPFSVPLIALAPMAGVTDLPFRKMVQSFPGVDLVFCEMLASWAIIHQAKKTLKRASLDHNLGPQAMQIVGNDPEMMAQAAKLAEDLGACLIDINMGCPAKKIAVNSYAGAALMQNEKLVVEIFKKVAGAVRVPVTVKMRMGWDHHHLNALKIAHIAHQEGLAWVTLHGRTRCQLFTGQADWDFIGQFQKSCPLPVIGNGDITRVQKAQDCLQHGVQGVMVGRGTYGRPWFLSQIATFLKDQTILPEPSALEQKAIVQQHFTETLAHYGKEHGLKIARKHLGWYSKGIPMGSTFRKEVFASDCSQQVQALIEDFYSRWHESGPISVDQTCSAEVV